MGEIGNRPCDEESLFWCLTRDEIVQDDQSIRFGIFSVRIATALTVAPYGVDKPHITDCIRKDDTRSPSARQRPNTSIWVEDTELETCTSPSVEFFYLQFSCGLGDTKWIGKLDILPMTFLSVFFT